MRVAKSSKDQCETGGSASWGLVVTRTKTLGRSSGGKSPRSARAREIVQAFQALALKAVTPLRDGVGVATQFGSHVVVAGDVWAVAAEDQAGAKGHSLGRG